MSVGPYGQPTGSPSPEATSLSTPIWTDAPSTSSSGAAAPPDFINWVTTILNNRIGHGGSLYLPGDQLSALINKVWLDSGIQAAYDIQRTQPVALPALLTQISNVLLGQGDDPSVVNDYVALKETLGVGLTQQEQAALTSANQVLGSPVPKPFGTSNVSGYDFGTPMPKGGWTGTGQSYGWDKHYGVDYGTRAGERIVSPFAGTVTSQSNVAGYGNYVTVTLDNGWKIGFGHVAQGTVPSGTRVNPGDLIAIAGANVGSAQGSVTIVTWQDPKGGYVNPHDILDPVFHGTTFEQLRKNGQPVPGIAGTGMPTVNAILDREYPTIKSDWQTFFGSPPSPEDVYNVIAHGNDPAQWTQYIRSLPGHIPGMNIGQTYDLRQTVDAVSSKVLGHPGTDGIVKELFDQQKITTQAVTNWYNEHGVTGIEPATYQKIVQANQPILKNIFNEVGFDPRLAQLQAERQAAAEARDLSRGEHGHGAVL